MYNLSEVGSEYLGRKRYKGLRKVRLSPLRLHDSTRRCETHRLVIRQAHHPEPVEGLTIVYASKARSMAHVPGVRPGGFERVLGSSPKKKQDGFGKIENKRPQGDLNPCQELERLLS